MLFSRFKLSSMRRNVRYASAQLVRRPVYHRANAVIFARVRVRFFRYEMRVLINKTCLFCVIFENVNITLCKMDLNLHLEPFAQICSERCLFAGLRRAGLQFQRRKIHDRENLRRMRESSLLKIKETEPLAPAPKQKLSFLRYCCNTCTPASRVSLIMFYL